MATAVPGDHMDKANVGLPDGVAVAELGDMVLESGATLRGVRVAYSTYGALNAAADNCVVVGHSLTSNSCVAEWWGPMLGAGPAYCLDTACDFVVCCNYLGSPYGSSSPVTASGGVENDAHGPEAHGASFPVCTVRDNVVAQRAVLDRLGVRRVRLAIGGSMGAMHSLEWAVMYPDYVDTAVLIAGCGRHTDWAIGMGEVQRQIIAGDEKWLGGNYDPANPPTTGLAASRMMAMLSYRAPQSLDAKFARGLQSGKAPPDKPTPFFAVESYLQYQGRKFIQRFDANCYVQLTHTLDSMDVARGRGEYHDVLARITQRVFVVGIDSDVLYPLELQRELADGIPNATLYTIASPHGHDSFLIEIEQLNGAVRAFRDGYAPTGATSTAEATKERLERDLAESRREVQALRARIAELEARDGANAAPADGAGAAPMDADVPAQTAAPAAPWGYNALHVPANPGPPRPPPVPAPAYGPVRSHSAIFAAF